MREHLTPERKAKIREDFKGFLRSFTTSSEEGKPKRKYERKVEEMAFDEGKHDLVMDYSDLTLFSTEMVEELFSYPKEILNEFNTALEEEVERKNPDLEPSEVRKHRVRLKGFRREKDIRSLFGSEYIGELVSLNGVVAKATRVRPRLKKAMFRCKKCTHTFAYEIPTTYQEPRNCPAANCSNTNSFRMVEELEYEKFQILWVQEPLGRIPPGELPKSIPVRVRGDMTGEVRPGERITVYGILDSTPKDRLRKGNLPLYNTFVESTYIEGEEKESEVKLTADEKERIKDLKEDPELEEKVVGSIAPSIQGFENVKKAIAAALFEGTPKELGEGTRVRHTINVFLVGDPGTGKSRILRQASRVAPRSLYTSGKGSSAAGLTAATVKTDSGWGLEAGALILADKGVAFIDELDKMDSKDRDSLHEAMSNLSVSIAKAGNIATLNARTSVVAAANPKLGRYVKDRDLSENIDLPPTILSRFDLIFLMLDVPNEERDRKVATHVLDIHTRDKRPTPAFDREFFKKYILYARKNVSPTLTSEARDRILDFYVEIRKSQDQTVPITMRQLESLVRIAEAHSKMLLREKATKESAEFAIDLMKNSLFQVARGGEGVDIDKVVAGTSTEERSRYMIVVDIIKERGEEYEEGGVPFEVIVEDAREKGIREGFVREVIKREKKRGSIYTPKENHYKIIPKGGP